MGNTTNAIVTTSALTTTPIAMFILLLLVRLLLLSAVSPIRAITASTPLLFCVIWGCTWAPPPRATPPFRTRGPTNAA